MTVIKQANMTCSACPAQWEGHTENNEPIYIRYRWGYLSIRKGNVGDEDGVAGEEIFGKQIGDGFDGMITIGEVAKHARDGDILFSMEGC